MKYGRYEIVKEVGRGAMGVVYQAHDPQIDRMVALKVLRQDRVVSKDLVNRFLKEAKAIGRLSHPNIVTVYDVGHDNDTIYIAMEFLEGTPLNETIKEDGLAHDKTVALAVQMAEAIDYAHNRGIIHRDIKPTNIIVTAMDQVKITDFGIARIEDPSATQQTQAGEILGTPVYMSPEQIMGKPIDGRSDLYALGVILYELSTGTRPFKGNNLAAIFRAITQDTPIDPAEIRPSMSPALAQLILKSLSKNPEQRFQTGRAMAQALEATLKKDETALLAEVPVQKKSTRPWFAVAAVLLGIFAVGGFSYYFFAEKDRGSVAPPSQPESSQVKEAIRSGALKVESSPTGAQIFLDGSFTGRSPLTAELPLGKHEVRLSLPGHHDWEAQVQLREEGQTPLFVRLVPVDNSNP
jgi:serine/threonine protein kinase